MENSINSHSKWVTMDEIGFLESNELAFQAVLKAALDQKNMLAVVRKQNTDKKVDFLTEIINRQDAFVLDLDEYSTEQYWN